MTTCVTATWEVDVPHESCWNSSMFPPSSLSSYQWKVRKMSESRMLLFLVTALVRYYFHLECVCVSSRQNVLSELPTWNRTHHHHFGRYFINLSVSVCLWVWTDVVITTASRLEVVQVCSWDQNKGQVFENGCDQCKRARIGVNWRGGVTDH